MLIDVGQGWSVADNLDKFTGLDHNEIAHKLIDAGRGYLVARSLKSFANPDEVISLFRNMGKMDILINAKHLIDYSVDIATLDYADNSYTYLSGGFSRKTIGELIKSRMDNHIEQSIHDASQWLRLFQMPYEWVDIDAIKAHEGQMVDPDEYRVRLKDAGVEAKFILQLLGANLGLRKRLTYGTTPTFSDYDKLAILFTEERYKPLRGEFNARIGRGRRELTEQYYQELLADSAISQEWQTYQANSDKPQKKFFQKYLRSHPELAAELDRRAIELQIKVGAELLAATIMDDPSAQELINSRTSKGGEDWFYYPEYQLLYQAACSDDGGAQLYKSEDFSLDRLFRRAHDLVDSYYDSNFGKSKDETTHKLTKEELVQKLNRAFESLTANLDTIQSTPTWGDEAADADRKAQLAAVARNMGIKEPRSGLSDTVGELKRMSRDRKRYIQDTQTWLTRHALAQSGSLTQAWGDRALAIAEGVPDRASAIQAWQKLKGFRIRLDMAESSGELQDMGLSREYIDSRSEAMAELTRKLSVKGALRAISKIKRWTEGTTWDHKLLPAATARIELDNRPYSMDIFGKDDPRGFTIGEDTACCMTIDGEAKSCIKAGYKRENAGFLGIYEPSGDLLAQSFWYVHPNNPDVLVLDNIEANKGRNFSKLVNLYQKLIEQYLFDHPDLAIKEVRVGTGYSDVDLGDLKDVTSPDVLDGVYTDAYRQKVLWRKSS